jgi:hypothetical protein
MLALFFFNDIPRNAYLYHLLGQRGVIKECTIVRIPNIFSRVFIHNSNAHWNYDVIDLQFYTSKILVDFLGPGVWTCTFWLRTHSEFMQRHNLSFSFQMRKNLKIPTRKKTKKTIETGAGPFYDGCPPPHHTWHSQHFLISIWHMELLGSRRWGRPRCKSSSLMHCCCSCCSC